MQPKAHKEQGDQSNLLMRKEAMRKPLLSISITFSVLLFCFWLFPSYAKASTIQVNQPQRLSIDDSELSIFQNAFQSIILNGSAPGDFEVTIDCKLTSFPLCSAYNRYIQLMNVNDWGIAAYYVVRCDLTGVDQAGGAYQYDSIHTTEPVQITLNVPEYINSRPGREFILLSLDSDYNIVELGRGTDHISFKTDFSCEQLVLVYQDKPTTSIINFTVADPVPGERAGDPKYRPQTDSTLCLWNNNVSFNESFKVPHYRWSTVDPETGYGIILTENDVFEAGRNYSVSIEINNISVPNPTVLINGETPEWDIRSADGKWGQFDYRKRGRKSSLVIEDHKVTASFLPATEPKKKVQHVCSDNDYEWDYIRTATEITDGEMRYQCRICGNVKYDVPISAYYQFNANTVDKIKNAAKETTVTVDTPLFVSFHQMVCDELIARPDVGLVVRYSYNGKKYQMLIPAGSGDKLAKLYGDSKFCGFRNMAGSFTTAEFQK